MEVLRVLVNDFDNAFRFYAEQMGLRVVWGKLGDVYASFDNGKGGEIGLFTSDLMAAALGNSTQPQPVNQREKIIIILHVDSVDVAHEALTAKGVAFVNPPTDMVDWGMRVAHLRDPEGNTIELCSALTGNTPNS